MSQLLLQWLNDEIQLSKKVSDLELEFANGYLFGELLNKYNQQLNFDEFQNKQLRNSKIKNFELLQPTFKTLKIKFDTQTVAQIIKQTPGLAEQILYSLKMALEKVNDPADVLIHAKTGKYNAIVPLKVIQQPKEQYDKMEAEFFERRLNEMNKAQKEVNLDEHQRKFDRFKQNQDSKILKFKNKEENEQRTLKEEMRKIQLNKLQRNMAFMEDWNQKGIENWKKNQDIRKNNNKNDLQFANKQEDRKLNRLQQLHESTKVEMVEQIEQFELNLHKQDDIDEDGPQDRNQNFSPTQQVPGTISRIHQNKVVTEFLRKERDKRRRKMIVDQGKQHGDLQRREAAVLEKIKQQSRQEKEILYEVWRAYQCKLIITQNRSLRDEKYKQKQELNVINIKFKEEEMLRTIRQEYKDDLKLQLTRERELQIEIKLQERKNNYGQCKSLIDQLFEYAEQCYEYLQNSDSQVIGDAFLSECNKLFIAGKELPPPKRFRTFDPVPQLKAQERFESSEDQKIHLSTSELQDYIQGKGQWIPYHKAVKGEGLNSGDPSLDEKFLPALPINNFYLGNLVRHLIEKVYSNSPVQTKHRSEMPNHLPFRCSLIGYAFCGKSSISELLSKKYGIQLIGVETVVNELMEYYRRWQEHERQLLLPQRMASPESQISDRISSLAARAAGDVNSKQSQRVIESRSQTRMSNPSRQGLSRQALKSQERDASRMESSQVRQNIEEQDEIRQSQHSLKQVSRTSIPQVEQQQSQSRKSVRQTAQGGAHLTTETYWDQEMLSIAKQIHDTLLQGLDVPDELFVRALCFKLRHTFKNRSSEEAYEDYEQIKENTQNAVSSPQKVNGFDVDDQPELEGIHREDFHRKNMAFNRYPYCQGWLLQNFPHSYEQAKLLEYYLTGNQPKDELETTVVENKLYSAALVVQPTPIQEVERKPMNGGIPLVIYLDMPSNESSLKRALGRRYDAYTQSTYHLEDNPPPVDNAPLIERLQQVYELSNMEQQLSDKNTLFDSEIKQLRKWYQNYAYQSYSTIRKEVVLELPTKKTIEITEDRQEIDNPASQNQIEQEQDQEDPLMEEQKSMQIMSEKQLSVKFVEEKIPKSFNSFQKIDASKKIEDVFFQVDQLVQQMLEVSELKVLNSQQERERQQLMGIQQAEQDKLQLEQDGKWLQSQQKDITSKLDEVIKKNGVSQRVVDHLLSFWEKIERNYLRNTRSFFRNVKDQREVILTRMMDMQQKYIDLLSRQDEKFYLARNYQQDYNIFVSINPDLLEEDETKQELHQRVEDLLDLLSDIIDQKRDDALEERKKHIDLLWVENEMERFLQEVQRLLQCELDRTQCSIQLLNDYYSTLDGRDLIDLNDQFTNNEISANPETLPSIEQQDDPNCFPRLDKMLYETLRIINGEEEMVDDKNKKGAKVTKKEEVKKAPVKKGVIQQEEVKKELSSLELESQKAINIEKAILRYRVQVIRDAATNMLKYIRSNSRQIYQKMEEWSFYTHKCEIDAIQTMGSLFREAIENEEKIQKEVQLNFVDVVVSHEMLNFLTPVPPPLPAREAQNSHRLSISQLYHLIEDLRAITSNQLTIDSKSLVLLLSRKGHGVQKEDLCATIRVSNNEWFRVISKVQINGYVPVRTICSFFILMTSPILNLQEKKIYQQALNQHSKNGMIEKDKFIDTPSWFDSYESVPEEQNTNYFDRAVYIKELLFFIHNDADTESINIQGYLDTLHIQNPGVSTTYYEYLFSQ